MTEITVTVQDETWTILTAYTAPNGQTAEQWIGQMADKMVDTIKAATGVSAYNDMPVR